MDRTAPQRLDPGSQLGQRERLAQVIIPARAAQHFDDGQAVQARQQPVHYEHVGLLRTDVRQALGPFGGTVHHVAADTEVASHFLSRALRSRRLQ